MEDLLFLVIGVILGVVGVIGLTWLFLKALAKGDC